MKKENTIGSVADITAGNFNPDKVFKFWLFRRTTNEASSYSKDDRGTQKPRIFPYSFRIKLEENILYNNPLDRNDKWNGKTRIIRLCAGETSIFKDEQSDDRENPKVIMYLDFVDGHNFVRGNDTLLLEFVKYSNRFFNNPNRDKAITPLFFLEDKNKIVEQAMDMEDKLFELKSFIKNPDNLHKVLAYARVIFGATEYKKFENPKHVIFAMSKKCEANPDLFEAGLNNPSALRKHYILEAIEDGKLRFNEQTNSIQWRNGGLIQQAPFGASPIDLFVDNISSDKSGHLLGTYKMILKELGVISEGEKQEEEVSNVSHVETPKLSDEEQAIAYINECIAKGVLTIKGKSTVVFREGKDDERKFVGRKGAAKSLLQDTAFADNLNRDMNALL